MDPVSRAMLLSGSVMLGSGLVVGMSWLHLGWPSGIGALVGLTLGAILGNGVACLSGRSR